MKPNNTNLTKRIKCLILNSQFSILNSFVKKEFTHIWRDKRTLLLVVGIPMMQMLIIGFALSTDVKHVKTAICTPAPDATTRAITQRLAANEHFDVVAEVDNPAAVEELFKNGQIGFAVLFSDRFADRQRPAGDAAIQLLADATDPNQGAIAAAYATQIINNGEWRIENEGQNNSQFLILNSHLNMLYNPEMHSSYNFVPGLMGLIFILICAMMTSVAIVREKETGTMEVLLASPVKPLHIIAAKMLPYFLISWFNLIAILLMSVYLLDVPVSGNLVALNLFSLLFIVVSLALGLFISTVAQTQVAAMLASAMGLMMPIMILSGMLFPIESMPWPLQWLSAIVPARWYISGVRKIMIEGVGLDCILTELSVLVGMATLILTISLKNFKVRLQ